VVHFIVSVEPWLGRARVFRRGVGWGNRKRNLRKSRCWTMWPRTIGRWGAGTAANLRLTLAAYLPLPARPTPVNRRP